MKLEKLSIALVFLVAGCGGSAIHGQVPPTSFNVAYTWQAPVATSSWPGCSTGQPVCSYVLSTLTVPVGTATCPAPSSTVVYTPVNQAAPTTNLSYTYLAATAGQSLCAVVQTLQSGSYSVPSVPSNVVAIPQTPGAPSAPGGATQVAVNSPMPQGKTKEMAMNLRGYVLSK